MKDFLLHRSADHLRTFAWVLDPDEDPITVLTERARIHFVASCQITAVGAFSQVTLGYFDRRVRTYQRIPVAQQVEVLSLIGDIALDEREQRVVHVHCTVGLSDGTTRGGHLLEARVWPTLEVIVTEWPRVMQKRFVPEVGLALIDHLK